MVAYERVAGSIGTSASWLRKFIKGHEVKEPGWRTGWNILDQYSKFCDRVTAEIEADQARMLALKRKIDAITEIAHQALESTTRTQGVGTTDPGSD
jgi:hypothetical protein